jgi:hypothetical protein
VWVRITVSCNSVDALEEIVNIGERTAEGIVSEAELWR